MTSGVADGAALSGDVVGVGSAGAGVADVAVAAGAAVGSTAAGAAEPQAATARAAASRNAGATAWRTWVVMGISISVRVSEDIPDPVTEP